MKIWTLDYNGHSIRVENTWLGARLLVDGVIQDEFKGIGFSIKLNGKISSGTSAGEVIKVSLGGFFAIDCSVFVDDKPVLSSSRSYS